MNDSNSVAVPQRRSRAMQSPPWWRRFQITDRSAFARRVGRALIGLGIVMMILPAGDGDGMTVLATIKHSIQFYSVMLIGSLFLCTSYIIEEMRAPKTQQPPSLDA